MRKETRPKAADYRMIKPPQVQFEIHQTHKLRFSNTVGNPATAVSFANLLETVLFATTATIAYQLYDYVRIKEIEIWATSGDATNSQATIGVDFGGLVAGNIGGGRSYQDMTVSDAYPAYLRVRPDPKSQTAQFQPNSSSVAFHIRSTGAAFTTIVDVTLEFRNSPVVNPVVSAVSAATSGEIYFRGLDGLNNASTAWRSQLGPNII